MMKETRPLPRIETERLLLAMPQPEAAPRLLAFFEENREHLARWSPPAPAGYYTQAYWRERLAQARTEFERDQSMKLVLFERESSETAGVVIGVCNFTNFVRGPFQACYLGYSLGRRFEGRGLMFEALEAATRYAFDHLRLHRIMANYVPVNERSGKLLRRLGFVIEGYARDYLLIEGRWQDHILTSLTNSKLKAEDL
ncbi:MAG TPA: ribosomal protein S5-alanine N-acetyltransferase [Pyrinomonadaceae bacterium]|jgi:ribosomal-protein-alanine N-acetyltransferase|nr:ribosomal protein S5-alanine N-acetyltransferase [Pyrinomonadaceae bacterium]